MKAAVLLSGGLDSTTCLAEAVHEYGSENVLAISVFYGQKHIKEMDCSEKIAGYYNVRRICIDLSDIFAQSNSSLLSHSTEDIPKESYERQLEKTGGEPVSTYVPFRNGLFLSSAAAAALSWGCGELYYGAHRDDSAGNAYPDCSEEFFDAMNRAVYEGSGRMLILRAPFIKLTKADVVRRGLALGVPYELTWSCYEGKEKPCGICGTCRDRIAAFEKNGVTDPLMEQQEKPI